MLTTTLTEWGVEQTRTFRNKDRCHEEIHEIPGDLPNTILTKPQLLRTYATLIVGDCNAGKTTLLYSLINEDAFLEFHKIQSLIPTVIGAFHNYRFCDVSAMKQSEQDPLVLCCDHPDRSLMDTDISKVSLTLSAVDWNYLVEELGCSCPCRSDITTFTLIEMGGDHLRRIASTEPSDPLFAIPQIQAFCDNSRALLSNKKLVCISYMVNAESCQLSDGQLSDQHFDELESNLRLIKGLSKNLKKLDIYIARLPPRCRSETAPEESCAYCEGSADVINPSLDEILSSAVAPLEVDQFRRKLYALHASELFQALKARIHRMTTSLWPDGELQIEIRPFCLLRDESDRRIVDVPFIYYFLQNALTGALEHSEINSDSDLLLDLVDYLEATRYYQMDGDKEILLTEYYDLEHFNEFAEKYDAERSRTAPAILSANFDKLMALLVLARAGEGADGPGYRFPRDPQNFATVMSAIRSGCLSKPETVDWPLIAAEVARNLGARAECKE